MNEREVVVRCAKSKLGKRYVYAGHGPDSFDCSGLVGFCYREAGIDVGFGSVYQYSLGTAVNKPQPGDVGFWDTFGAAPGHDAIYIGDNTIIHAFNENEGVVATKLPVQNMGGNNRFMGWRNLGLSDKGAPDPPKDEDESGDENMSLTFGNCKIPAHDVRIVKKPWEGAGFDRVPPRNNVGMCMHKWWGYGDALSLYRLFSSGGERQADALTDWSLTQEGDLVMLNEPWKTRAGWANGPANDLEGDGVLFVRKLGVSAVNSRIVSVEFEGKAEKLTDLQLEIGSSLWAYYYDAWGVSWEDYPMNPKIGCNTDLDHWEIGDKECPFAGARSQRHQFQSMVKGKMRAGQTGSAPDPIDPKPQPNHEWLPRGLTEEVVRELFGRGTRHNIDGTATPFEFDMKGLISNAWLARGNKLNLFPSVKDWWVVDDEVDRNIVTFEGGWVLQGNSGDRSAWKWQGE
jgi:cell wall-associated NlpC family hydrolase